MAIANTNGLKGSLTRFDKGTDVAEVTRVLARDGGCVISNFLTANEVRSFNNELDPYLAKLNPAGNSDIPELFRDFQGRNTKRLNELTTISKTWRDVILNDDYMHAICHEILEKPSGSYWLSTAQMIEIGPGSAAQPLHRDAGNWWPFYEMGPKGPDTYVNFLVALTDTTEENGATRYSPGSDKWPFDANDANVGEESACIPCELRAGDVLVIKDRIVHGGGANKTKDFFRRVVSVAICTSAFAQEEAHCLLIDRDLVKTLPKRAQAFLGFRSQYPKGSPGLMTVHSENIAKYLGLDS
ncbi:hypothetical protein BKA61DRAFT_253057 [Leptodontidium sp. MPI-SDFR-AT-0119]|nr:hypothetical protein BKA61DRAFT_253057 [Leptodontidium sp. MPI-SDFR-AT-0119]